jgi:hypothetical protein
MTHNFSDIREHIDVEPVDQETAALNARELDRRQVDRAKPHMTDCKICGLCFAQEPADRVAQRCGAPVVDQRNGAHQA